MSFYKYSPYACVLTQASLIHIKFSISHQIHIEVHCAVDKDFPLQARSSRLCALTIRLTLMYINTILDKVYFCKCPMGAVVSLHTELINVRGVPERTYTRSTGEYVECMREMYTEYGIISLYSGYNRSTIMTRSHLN